MNNHKLLLNTPKGKDVLKKYIQFYMHGGMFRRLRKKFKKMFPQKTKKERNTLLKKYLKQTKKERNTLLKKYLEQTKNNISDPKKFLTKKVEDKKNTVYKEPSTIKETNITKVIEKAHCVSKNNDFFKKISFDDYEYPVEIEPSFENPERIICNNKIYSKQKIIGKGGYGKIILYEDLKNNTKIILKIEKNNIITEKKIGHFISNNPKCNTIRVRYVDSIDKKTPEQLNYYILDYLDGDLEKLITIYKEKKQFKEWFTTVVEEIRKQIVCLYKEDYFYTDLKLANILYCFFNNKFTIHLGDLGSVTPLFKGYNIASFPPIEYNESGVRSGFIKIESKIQAKQILTWLLGIIGLHIIDANFCKYNLHFIYIRGNEKEDLESEINKIIDETDKINEKYKVILKNLLIFDPEQRIENVDIENPLFQ